MNTLVDMISGMEVKEDDEDFMNAVDYMYLDSLFGSNRKRIPPSHYGFQIIRA